MPVFEGVKQALTFENVLIAIAVIVLGVLVAIGLLVLFVRGMAS